MRPVDKGVAPGPYATYQDAGPDLQGRLGDYCSYCERQIETNLAVEHIRPKSLEPALETEWTNFLLGCVNCNSSKGNTAVDLADYIWPDLDNTLRALDYVRGGLIRPRPGLPANLSAKATATINLLGLDRDPGNPGREPSNADRRWLRRQQAWEIAERCKQKLEMLDAPEVRDLIVDVAIGRGEFSIWWTVFSGDVDIRRRLRQAFIGTHPACFDVNEDLVARDGGQL
jgi:uncharacterized protein (TIGR02646 family)